MIRSIWASGKTCLAGALERSGVLWRILDRKLTDHVAVLTYHRVLPEIGRDSFSAPGIIVTPETFDRHMAWIKANLSPLTPNEFQDVLSRRRIPPKRACLVTFDDGWFDNLEFALPILERYRVPALFFVACGYVGTSMCFWQEHLSRLLSRLLQEGPRGTHLLESLVARWGLDVATPIAARDIRSVIDKLKSQPPDRIASVVGQVDATTQEIGLSPILDLGDDRFLSWIELSKLAASDYATIGSHSESHVPLPKLQPEQQMMELGGSRAVLENHLNLGVQWFAYPNGDYDGSVCERVREAGYVGAFTTVSDRFAIGQDPFRIPRINMHDASSRTLGRFLARLTGVL